MKIEIVRTVLLSRLAREPAFYLCFAKKFLGNKRTCPSYLCPLVFVFERNGRNLVRKRGRVDTCTLRTNSSHAEVYLNGNTVGISHAAPTIVRWLCSLAHSHAAKSHTLNKGSLSLRFSLSQPFFLSLFLSCFARYLLFATMAMQTSSEQGRAARRALLLRLPEKLSCCFKNGISLIFSQ